jgi:CheY-like chemotaxis protein
MWLPARPRGGAEPAATPSVLALTSDDRLYCQLLSAAIDPGWKITWARSIVRAFELCCAQPRPLVVCDQCLPGMDWRDALRSATTLPDHPVVLLAVPQIDEEVWASVLRCHGYDAVRRAAGSAEWRRELRFAWTWRSARYSTRLHDESGLNRVTGVAPPFDEGAMSF